MKKLLLIATTLFCAINLSWAYTSVTNESELIAAIEEDGAYIVFENDISIGSSLIIDGNKNIVIRLEGHTLNRGLAARANYGQVICIREGSTLSLNLGTVTGGYGGAGGAIQNDGDLVIEKVNVLNNTADDRGGGICNNGTMTMKDCIISGNNCNDHTSPSGGGGLFNASGATASLTRVTITGNNANVWGGGGICNYGDLTLKNCTISDNMANYNGGGIWHGAQGALAPSLTLENCTITHNHAGNDGGGIYSSNAGTLTIQSTNTIIDNTIADAIKENVFLLEGMLITINGSISGSRVGVNMETPGVFTSGYSNDNSGVDPSTIFSSDMDPYLQLSSTDTEVALNKQSENAVYYVERHWDGSKVVNEIKTVTNYTVLNGGGSITLTDEYYVVKGNVTYDNITEGNFYLGDINIILCDGAKLTTNYINLNRSAFSLSIYGQQHETGQLSITGDDIPDNQAGLGGRDEPFLDLVIHGGRINATGGDDAAGIGGGGNNSLSDRQLFAYFGQITIYGGSITAHGGSNGAGIGLGIDVGAPTDMEVGTIKIYGGKIYAYGGDDGAGIGGGDGSFGSKIEIYGGYIEAMGYDGAGIGGGDSADGGTITINGGTVKADGWGDSTSNGAGIGGGVEGSGGTVTINGGYVEAHGGIGGAGIGGGERDNFTGDHTGSGGNVTINGGIVIARSGRDETGNRAIGPGFNQNDYYGSLTLSDSMMVSSERLAVADERVPMCWYRTKATIQPCTHSELTYTVDGTTAVDHHISHCPYCLHSDTALHTFDDHDSCTVCGVKESAFFVKLYMPHAGNDGSFDGETYDSVGSHLVVPGSFFTLPMATLKVPGLKFVGWEATTAPAGATYTSPYTTTSADTLYRVGNRYIVLGGISFVARYSTLDVTLLDTADNAEVLSHYDGMLAAHVTLSGRTFVKNEIWNSLCLPFSLSAEQLAASPLTGCTLMQLDTEGTYGGKKTGFDPTDGTLYLFFESATEIQAGRPYIAKWLNGLDIQNPVLDSVTLTSQTANVSAPFVTFKGLYGPQTFVDEQRNVLFLNNINWLRYPDGIEPTVINSFRAYFQVYGLQDGTPASAAPIRIVMNLDENQGVTDLDLHEKQASAGKKFIIDGTLYILRDGILYDVLGRGYYGRGIGY